jgi:pantothenate kinase
MEFVLQQENSKQKGKLLKQKEQEISKNSSRRSNDIIKLRSIEAFLNYLNQVIQNHNN